MSGVPPGGLEKSEFPFARFHCAATSIVHFFRMVALNPAPTVSVISSSVRSQSSSGFVDSDAPDWRARWNVLRLARV